MLCMPMRLPDSLHEARSMYLNEFDRAEHAERELVVLLAEFKTVQRRANALAAALQLARFQHGGLMLDSQAA